MHIENLLMHQQIKTSISSSKSVLRLLFQHPSTLMLLEKYDIFTDTEFYDIIRPLKVRFHLFYKFANFPALLVTSSIAI